MKFFYAIFGGILLIGLCFQFCAAGDTQKKVEGCSVEILQNYGAQLHPRCLEDVSPGTSFGAQKKRGLLSNTLLNGVTSLIQKKETESESIIETKEKDQDKDTNIASSLLQNSNLPTKELAALLQGVVEQLAPLIVTLHNSQVYTGEDQQQAIAAVKEQVASLPKEEAFNKIETLLGELEKQPNMDPTKILEIRTELKQIRNQQKSWIPSATREVFAFAREGVTVVAVVATLIIAKKFGFM